MLSYIVLVSSECKADKLQIYDMPLLQGNYCEGGIGMQSFAEFHNALWETDPQIIIQILDALGFGIALVSRECHKILYVNEKFLVMSGYEKEMVLGCECHRLMCPAEKGHCPIDDLEQAVDNAERDLCRADGSFLPIIKTVVPMKIGGKHFLLESFADIAKQKEMQERLASANDALQQEVAKRRQSEEAMRYLAYHDSLTELPNRLSFMGALGQAVQDESANFAVVCLNLNGFKLINTTMSHAIGDEVLYETAKRLEHILPSKALLGHFGGDEFVVLYPEYKEAQLQEFLVEAGNQIKKPFRIKGQEVFVTAAFGVSLYPADGPDAEILLQNASIAMRLAKEEKRRWALCTCQMKDDIKEYMELSNQLFRSIEREELLVYYQPQVDSCSGGVIGLEALVRWNHSQWGFIPTPKFISIAEKNGFIHALGEWVLRTACQQNKAWQDAGLAQIPVAVNLSALQFNNPHLLDNVAEVLAQTGLEARYLELEVTESVVMRELESIVDTLQAFVDMEVVIALDDFGTEYSSLQYLKRLPVGKVKIARPFVQGIGVDAKDEAIISSLMVLAEQMGLRILAEGVETKQQLEFLQEAKCREIQGFYFAKPLPAREIPGLLVRKKMFEVKC